MDDRDVLVCRCEEVGREEILQAIACGHHTVDSIKRAVRTGMGACQGRTCAKLIMNMLLEQGVQTRESLAYGKPRFPVVPCTIDALGGGDK
ncbi:proline dehydrogenase subunit delta [Spirochaetia bacterium]|nr:proline dehydrogenase subunit delta [Spirochaetia bacterium]